MEATTSDPTLDVALVLRSAILQAPAGGQVPICPFFDDRVLPLDCLPHELPQAAPSLRRICQVLETIAAVGDVEEACLVGALMQLEKVLQLSDTILCAHNWRLLVFISIITAAKLLYDAAVFNDDFAGAFPLLSHSQLAAAEIRFLQLLHWEPDASGKAHDTFANDLPVLAAAAREAPMLSVHDLKFIAERSAMRMTSHGSSEDFSSARAHCATDSRSRATPESSPVSEAASMLSDASTVDGKRSPSKRPPVDIQRLGDRNGKPRSRSPMKTWTSPHSAMTTLLRAFHSLTTDPAQPAAADGERR